MGLDFKRCTDLFLGGERELALALDLPPDEVRRLRAAPGRASPAVLRRLAGVLEERGRGMLRVSEMLLEAAADEEARGNGMAGG